ncbi:MAG: YcgN family cysteine cluster protein [Gammaproteobacteria bacterium]|nr:YcgN family cysteine cluster protein [Gammaproteobacteria bacterium]
MSDRFWETKSLEELDDSEWEALCDGCAQCCRLRFRASESEQVITTTLVCALLDIPTRRCTKYPKRHELVPDCVELTPETARAFHWLPETCAYRRVAEGRPLEDWHPLISGTTETVTDAGVSVTDKVVSAANVHPDDIASSILKWV